MGLDCIAMALPLLHTAPRQGAPVISRYAGRRWSSYRLPAILGLVSLTPTREEGAPATLAGQVV